MVLNGKRMLVLRSAESSMSFTAKIKQQGGIPIFFPTFDIQALIFDSFLVEEARRLILNCDWIIWTSQYAVHHLPMICRAVLYERSVNMVCIGPTTGAALQEIGLMPCVILPAGSTSENLLDAYQFEENNIRNKKIILISGEGGRSILFDTLSNRGAAVYKLAVYQRVLSKMPVLTEAQLINWDISVIYISSCEALDNLFLLADDSAKAYLKRLTVYALSNRLKAYAEQLGFNLVIVKVL